jgi:hypothetical protein
LAVTKQVAEKMKAVEQAKTNGDEAETYIMSIFKILEAKCGPTIETADVQIAKDPPHPSLNWL